MNKKGFTLVEVLAVIVILTVLMIVATTSGFGLFNNAKNKLNEEQAKALEEGLNLFLLEIDEENCLDYTGNEVYNDAQLILDPPAGTTFTQCSDIREYIFNTSSDRGDLDGDGKRDMYKTIEIEKFIETGYVTGSNAKDIKNTGDITLEIKWEKDTAQNKMDGTYIAGFNYEQYDGENNATNIALYVDAINGNNSNNGKSSANAVASIATAISKSGTKNLKIYLLSDATITSDINLDKDLTIASNGGNWTLDMNSKKITTTANSITYSNIYIKNKPSSFLTESSNQYNNAKITLYNYSYNGSYQTFTAPQTGTYELEVWGAQGGSYNTANAVGGKGGYSKGTVNLSQNEKLYVYVGQQPTTDTTGGYNGGGTGKKYSSYTYAKPGGGATDIRTIYGSWDNLQSLYSRIIVAGGGSGGAAYTRTPTYKNGYAGGGSTALGYDDNYKATATSAGTGGSFGKGANVSVYARIYLSGAGGGGWYGGGSDQNGSSSSTTYLEMSGGGSGYVYTSSTLLTSPEYSQPNSKYYLTNTQMIDGNTSLPTTSSPSQSEVGHSGNGYAKITLVLNS